MKRKLIGSLACLIILMFIVLLAIACNPQNSDEAKSMLHWERGKIKNLSFNLEGVKALGIERREVKSVNASDKMVAYADATETKNKLVGPLQC